MSQKIELKKYIYTHIGCISDTKKTLTQKDTVFLYVRMQTIYMSLLCCWVLLCVWDFSDDWLLHTIWAPRPRVLVWVGVGGELGVKRRAEIGTRLRAAGREGDGQGREACESGRSRGGCFWVEKGQGSRTSLQTRRPVGNSRW